MATLEIGHSSSKCLDCRKAGKPFWADPSELGHYHVLGYGSENGSAGCQQPWTEIVDGASYYGKPGDSVVQIRKMFPHIKGLPIRNMTLEDY
jgi:hypothetical protein